MAGKLEISFNSPQCGWMSIGFEDAVNEFHTTTAHAPHAFALAELMQILTRLTDPASPENDYVVKWNRDPEEFDFRFVRDGGNVTLSIYQYATDEREAESRELVYKYTGEVNEVCHAFAATFAQLFEDRETDEFEFNWRQPFPYEQYQEFRSRMA